MWFYVIFHIVGLSVGNDDPSQPTCQIWEWPCEAIHVDMAFEACKMVQVSLSQLPRKRSLGWEQYTFNICAAMMFCNDLCWAAITPLNSQSKPHWCTDGQRHLLHGITMYYQLLACWLIRIVCRFMYPIKIEMVRRTCAYINTKSFSNCSTKSIFSVSFS